MELFGNIKYLISLPIVLLLLLIGVYFAYKKRKNAVSKFADIKLFEKLIPLNTQTLRKIKTTLFITAVLLIFISLAGPQWGVKFSSGKVRLGQVVIALDASLSMLTEDIKPNRMENAKLMFSDLINKLSGYRIGIIAFSRKAFIQCPLTTDSDALKYFISRIEAGALPVQGTALSAPILKASDMMSRYPGQKALILLTDGEDHDTDALNNALKKAKENGIVIFSVGIGTPKGALIPLKENGKYKLDEKQNPVVSRLSEDLLIKLAAETKGSYTRYTDIHSVSLELSKRLKNMTTTEWKGSTRSVYKNRFQYPLFLALLLLLIEFLIPERKIWRKK